MLGLKSISKSRAKSGRCCLGNSCESKGGRGWLDFEGSGLLYIIYIQCELIMHIIKLLLPQNIPNHQAIITKCSCSIFINHLKSDCSGKIQLAFVIV